MAIQKEIWEADIVENLYAQNPHLSLCVNADQHVVVGKLVHIPNAGASPAVVKNRTNLPAAVTRRQDIDVTYPLDEFTSDPVHIPDADKAELSYDKRRSVLMDTNMALSETVGVMMLLNWAPSASRIIRTTGSAVPAHLGKGSRLKMLLADLKKAQKQFNRDNMPQEGRYAMLDADMIDQLTDQLTDTQYRSYSAAYDEKKGIVGELFGFKILTRSYVLGYKGLSAVAPVETPHVGTCAAALCWHISAVEGAKGDVKFFEDEGNPQYYGDIYSGLVRMGGRKRRADQKGVIAIVQGIEAAAWATGTKYAVGDFVTQNDLTYICIEAHTASAAFETDAAKWEVLE